MIPTNHFKFQGKLLFLGHIVGNQDPYEIYIGIRMQTERKGNRQTENHTDRQKIIKTGRKIRRNKCAARQTEN